MKTIAMYDAIGIQDFIFSSGKVKENVGASIIVQKVFEDDLKAAIDNIFAKVIYAGGGNAMVVYPNKNDAICATKRLSDRILYQTGGSLKFAVAYQDTDCRDFSNDRKELFKKLKKNKYQMVHQSPLLGIGITRQSATDGLPATEYVHDSKEYISKSAHFKRKTFEDQRGFFDYLLNNKDYEFPLEFDELGQYIGENYVAVVHIDGNNLGKQLDELIDNTKAENFEQSIKVMTEFSNQVDDKFKTVMKNTVQKLINGLKYDDCFYKKLNPVIIDNKWILPIRPIVLSGDDVTFVCNGKIGIALADEFLTELHNHSEIKINGSQIRISACAGVAIVKSHFPFYRAYQLAEELCRSAKMKGKVLAKMKNVPEVGSWMDFHIVQSGITSQLSDIREKFYQIPGMEPLKELKYPEYEDMPEMRYPQYHLLWRPWCVAGTGYEPYQWEKFKIIHQLFTGENKKNSDEKQWKRSRIKKLESLMTQSANEAEAYIRECKSRGFNLPDFLGNSDLFRDKQTPYFDALECLDFYIPLPELKE